MGWRLQVKGWGNSEHAALWSRGQVTVASTTAVAVQMAEIFMGKIVGLEDQ